MNVIGKIVGLLPWRCSVSDWIDPAILALFIPTFFFVSVTPGMCMTLAMTLGMSLGVRRTLHMMWGELLGVGLVSVLSVVGVAAVMLHTPLLFSLFKYVGGGYLLWLGLQMWRSRGKLALSATAEQRRDSGALALALQGFITAIANPKGWAFMVSLFGSLWVGVAGATAQDLPVTGDTTAPTAPAEKPADGGNPTQVVAIVIGVVGLGMTKAGALEFLSGSSSETLIVRIASLIAQHGVLAAVLAGLILAGILAATMSTADSQMLAAASSVSQNILQEFGHMKLTEKQSLFAARLTIICISVVGVVLARDPNSSVFGIVSFAWAGFGGSFGAVVLCSLFWKRCNWQGALAGMLSGGLMVFVWKYIISPLGGVFGIYELLPAFLMSLLVCVVVSLITPAPSAEIEAEFDAAK